MFRRGGPSYQAQGTGITSGLDQPRRGYGNGDFGQLVTQAQTKNVLPEDMHNQGFMRGVATAGAYDPDNPRTIGQMIYDASTAKSKYVDPIEAAKKERDESLANEEIRHAAEMEKEQAIIQGKLDVEGLKNKNAQAGKFMVLAVKEEIIALNTRKQEIDQKDPEGKDITLQNERENIMLGLNQLQKSIDVLSSMSPEGIDDMRTEFKETIVKERTNADGSLKPEYIEKYGVLITTADGEPLLDANGEKQYRKYTIEDVTEQESQARMIEFYTNVGYGRKTRAKGGRVGLAYSYPGSVGEAASMTETVDTPQGDMVISETEAINQAPGDQQQGQRLTFDELRARLPVTISDEIVNLLATSEQALLEFANIRTQQDIDKFNQVYRVDLALPEEA